jgi:hypothetical protein
MLMILPHVTAISNIDPQLSAGPERAMLKAISTQSFISRVSRIPFSSLSCSSVRPAPLHAARMSTQASTPDAPRQLKVLMLHGYTQSGALFHAKTRALEKVLQKNMPAGPATPLKSYPGGIRLVYPTGPLRLRPSDIPGYVQRDGEEVDESEIESFAWWRRNMSTGHYVDMEKGLEVIANTIREVGGIDGVVGFSQGAAAAAMVASLLEEGRQEAFASHEKDGGVPYPTSFVEDGKVINEPLKFAVIYSGFRAPHERYNAFYTPKIKTQTLHVIGTLDTLVSETMSQSLVDVCEDPKIVTHPGGHFVPIGREMAGALVGFVKEVCKDPVVEESVEDMDVPF